MDSERRKNERVGDSTKEMSSSEPALVQDQYRWTLYMSQVNLPAVLNDPRLNRRETDFFTKTWGETFEKNHVDPSTHLPNITRDHFKKYLRKISSVSMHLYHITYMYIRHGLIELTHLS